MAHHGDDDRPHATRDPAQQDMDRERTAQQVDRLLTNLGMSPRSRTAPAETEPLVSLLRVRREGAPPTVVRFADDRADGKSSKALVERRLLVLRAEDATPEVVALLAEIGYASTSLEREDRQGCEELLSRLSAFTRDEGGSDRVDDAVERLREEGVRASSVLVTALQAPVISTIVVKSQDGPAPTRVTWQGPTNLDPASDAIVVAVIDTGVTEDPRQDGLLNEVPRSAGSTDPLDALPYPRNGYLDFAAGHGTFVAGLVRQVDAECRIVSYTALDSDGLASELDVACAMIRAVVEGHAHVLNLSFGMRTDDDEPPVVLEVALEVIDDLARGSSSPAIVAAAGNYGNDDKVWPAAFDRVVAVGATTAAKQAASWSSSGPWVDCWTVGEGQVSTFVVGEEDPQFGGHDTYPPEAGMDPWAVWTGTSFAAPQVSGEVARQCRLTGQSPREAVRELLANAERLDGQHGVLVDLLPGTPTA